MMWDIKFFVKWKLIALWSVLLGFLPNRIGFWQARKFIYVSVKGYKADISMEEALRLVDKQTIGMEPADLWGKTYRQGEDDIALAIMVHGEDRYFEDQYEESCRCGNAGACIECNPGMFISGVRR